MAFDRPPQDKAMRPQETKKFHRKQKVKCPACHCKTPIREDHIIKYTDGSGSAIYCSNCGIQVRI